MSETFKGSFTQQEPISDAAIEAAVNVLRHGRLHRYNVDRDEAGEVALLEQEFAAFVGVKYCLAVASGGYALACALRAHGVKPGDPVLTNAFTLAPVPGAIASLGAVPVFVETNAALGLDFEHLETKIWASGAKTLLLSHMRGHQPDMDKVLAICAAHQVQLIEDCAHTMGGSWGGKPSGSHGLSACFSTQTYKHLNSGEGGLFVTNDADIAARAVLLSGSYMLFDRHLAAPGREHFAAITGDVPNISGRMDNLRAAILRPQLADLGAQVSRWSALHKAVSQGLRDTPGLALITPDPGAVRVGSSFQFLLSDWRADNVQAVVARCGARGVELKWFGADQAAGYTSRYDHWAYANPPHLPMTDKVLAGLVDMRLPLTFCADDARQIARIIRAEVGAVFQQGDAER
ncbi:MAG: DegT/DnrJ/EryC1/StrS family aminotransferase [Marinosulfonomonas sp.]|nr:DegT/DnrJ/EryC1/StrS family aminotransferase [Marinosulfonomonas sp.]